MREGETLPRESLEATVLKGVQVGRTAAAGGAGRRLAGAAEADDRTGGGVQRQRGAAAGIGRFPQATTDT